MRNTSVCPPQLSELRKRCRKSKHSQIPCDLSKAGKLWSACCLGFLTSQATEFHTNVVTGTGLQALANSVAKYGKRDCFSTLQKFVAGSYDGKICILYGLRRTGKTTLLFQMLSELPIEKTAYIKVRPLMICRG